MITGRGMNYAQKSNCLGILLSLSVSGAVSAAEFRMAHVFTDHMVLQRNMPVSVWGWAAPGESIQVTLGDKNATTVADVDGKWLAKLSPMEAGGPFTLTATGKSGAARAQDVLVGEVWLCSGQSNMQFMLGNATNGKEEVAATGHANIRLLHNRPYRGDLDKPAIDYPAPRKWSACTPESARTFSAVGYFFARHLHQELSVPIGMIECAEGGTPIGTWLSVEQLAKDPATVSVLKEWERIKPTVLAQEKEHEQRKAEHQREAAKARAAGQPPPPPFTRDKKFHFYIEASRRPGVLFNLLVHPLGPYTMRGVLWCQGEAGGEPYDKLLTGLITEWRALFVRRDLAFCVGQLHNVGPVQTDPNETNLWCQRRQMQFRVAEDLPHVGLAVTIDLGIVNDTHFPNKQDVGKRMSLWALGEVYGRPVACRGPTFKSMTAEGNSIRVEFDHAEGLMAKGGQVRGFVIAGADGKFAFADGRIDGRGVVLSSPSVARPVAVRYGWAMNPVCTLYNGAGLPAVPFRTDDAR